GGGAKGAAAVSGDVSAASSVASGNVGGKANVDIAAGDPAKNAKHDMAEAQGNVSGSAAQAGVKRTIGGEGNAAVSGGAGGVAEARAEGAVQGSAGAVRGPDAEGSVKMEASSRVAGSDPRPEVEARHDAVIDDKNRQQARAQDARDTAADPTGAATGAATDEAKDRSPVDTGEAKANVNVAADTIKHPTEGVKGQAEVSVDAQVRGGIDPTKKT
ncbi:MAG: hypothetical protein HOV81_24800, partial [Kofleriaceae bacterium]|nr:hypothetical protein [Kofleriaceae bacterium]